MTFLPLKGAYALTIRHLTIFLTVAQQGSMSAAAKVLYLSQPTVSQAIRELETHYNGLLFERLGKKLYLTERGRLLLPHAEELVQQFRQIEELMLNQSVKSVTFSDLPCTSEIFKELVEKCKSAAYTGNPVMLVGERGTGKEMLAQAIHNEGLYRTGMFMATSHNTAQQELLEKTIFNREDVGSGQLQTSLSGNTLFVDDVASLSWEKQSRLLTIIQNSSRLRTQVICGTATDLKEQVDEGNFSPELYYELELYTLVVPPLRMRGSDLKIYINRFLDEANRSFGKNIKLSKELDQALQRYSWRGNLRELTNFIYRMVDAIPIEEDEATLENIPRALIQKLESDTTRSFDLREIEKRAIIEALNSLKTRGLTKQEIADELGIGVATLYRKLKDYGIEANTLYR